MLHVKVTDLGGFLFVGFSFKQQLQSCAPAGCRCWAGLGSQGFPAAWKQLDTGCNESLWSLNVGRQ